MRASKAYIAGLGTTGVLLAASVALLFFVGALVGFDRWPGGTAGERVERVELRPGEEPAGLADAVAATPVAPAAAGVLPVAVGAPAPAPPTARLPGAAPAPGAPGGTTPAAPPAVQVGDPVVPPVDPGDPGSARDAVADTTQSATSELGAAVGQVSPEAGALIGEIGGGLSDQPRGVPLSLSVR